MCLSAQFDPSIGQGGQNHLTGSLGLGDIRALNLVLVGRPKSERLLMIRAAKHYNLGAPLWHGQAANVTSGWARGRS